MNNLLPTYDLDDHTVKGKFLKLHTALELRLNQLEETETRSGSDNHNHLLNTMFSLNRAPAGLSQ